MTMNRPVINAEFDAPVRRQPGGLEGVAEKQQRASDRGVPPDPALCSRLPVAGPGNQRENQATKQEAPSHKGNRWKGLDRIFDDDKSRAKEKRGQRDREAGKR